MWRSARLREVVVMTTADGPARLRHVTAAVCARAHVAAAPHSTCAVFVPSKHVWQVIHEESDQELVRLVSEAAPLTWSLISVDHLSDFEK